MEKFKSFWKAKIEPEPIDIGVWLLVYFSTLFLSGIFFSQYNFGTRNIISVLMGSISRLYVKFRRFSEKYDKKRGS